jgi:hypothetical protein
MKLGKYVDGLEKGYIVFIKRTTIQEVEYVIVLSDQIHWLKTSH